MANLHVSAEYRFAVDDVMRELQAEADQARRARGQLPGIHMSIVGGPTPEGRLTYIGVPDVVLDRLNKRGIPFTRT